MTINSNQLPGSQQTLLVLTGLSVAVLIISNLASTKITAFGPAVFDAGTILFPLAYIITDIISEVYGPKIARLTVWIGLAGLALLSIVLLAVQHMPVAAGYDGQAAFERILGFVPRITVASMSAYLAGETLNILVLARLKRRLGARRLFARLVGSSGIGELVDTLVFSTIAFAGTMPLDGWLQLVVTVYLFKLGFDVLFAPLSMRVISWIHPTSNINQSL